MKNQKRWEDTDFVTHSEELRSELAQFFVGGVPLASSNARIHLIGITELALGGRAGLVAVVLVVRVQN